MEWRHRMKIAVFAFDTRCNRNWQINSCQNGYESTEQAWNSVAALMTHILNWKKMQNCCKHFYTARVAVTVARHVVTPPFENNCKTTLNFEGKNC